MTRRRVATLFAGLAGLVGVVLIPAAGEASSSKAQAPSVEAKKPPPGDRCDPKPDKGGGPPPSKGKKCSSP